MIKIKIIIILILATIVGSVIISQTPASPSNNKEARGFLDDYLENGRRVSKKNAEKALGNIENYHQQFRKGNNFPYNFKDEELSLQVVEEAFIWLNNDDGGFVLGDFKDIWKYFKKRKLDDDSIKLFSKSVYSKYLSTSKVAKYNKPTLEKEIVPKANQSIFVGHDNDSNKKYIVWDAFSYDLTKFAYSASIPKEISKHVISCVKSMSWSKAELLSYNDEEGVKSYKFKFHWVLSSKLYSVDIDGNEMSCRRG
jgi:hypothetical protein